MPVTQYFKDKQSKSLNSFSNGDNLKEWKPDVKYTLEAAKTLKRTQADLHEGILAKYQVLRTKQLEGIVAENCYGKKSYSYLEAEQCEKFHFKNDYKLNLIDSFWKDHAPKHVLSY